MRWALAVLSVFGCRWGFEELPLVASDAQPDSALVAAGPITALASGSLHTCAIHETGRVSCWGYNGDGELGDPTATEAIVATPVLVSGLDQVVEISGGSSHTCARRSGGDVWCWGYGADGQLGDGGTISSTTPVAVAGLADAVQISAGYTHTCARRASGQLVCWGTNGSGELGDGSNSDSRVPVTVMGISNAIHVAAGGFFTCALRATGQVLCWGYNFEGELGDNTGTDSNVPVPPMMPADDTVELEVGIWTACARRAGGTIMCWGGNFQGELGFVSTAPRSLVPVTVAQITDAKELTFSSIGQHGCAKRANDHWWCWGFGVYGQIGDGAGMNRFSPVDTGLIADEVVAGGSTTCARTGSTKRCWGWNGYGQHGDGATLLHPSPYEVQQLAGAEDFGLGPRHLCFARTGIAFCTGINADTQLGDSTTKPTTAPQAVPQLSSVTGVSAGHTHSCATRSDGSVWCWGSNYSGELGNSSAPANSGPVMVEGLSNVATVHSGGNGFTCARRADFVVACWGRNASGQLGDGTLGSRNNAVAIGGLAANAINVGDSHVCAVRTNGVPTCWGQNARGQLGDGTQMDRSVPTDISSITDAIGISAGSSHSCLVRSDGTVMCWGSNESGQLGRGTQTPFEATPVTVPALSNVAEVSAGAGATCARRNDGTIACWGYGRYGVLGDGRAVTSTAIVEVTGISGAQSLDMGGDFACARTPTGIYCWGVNLHGELGDGQPATRLVP